MLHRTASSKTISVGVCVEVTSEIEEAMVKVSESNMTLLHCHVAEVIFSAVAVTLRYVT